MRSIGDMPPRRAGADRFLENVPTIVMVVLPTISPDEAAASDRRMGRVEDSSLPQSAFFLYSPAMKYETILFDLDGTLTDSEPGIVHSVEYALRRFGMEADAATLRSFIGPPLYDSFRGTMGMDDAEAKRAVSVYREYFQDRGIFENAPYPGVPEMLRALREAGRTLLVATSKPEVFARRIVEHFGLSLSAVYGADMEGRRSAKLDVIRYALAARSVDPSAAVMVGDRKYDIAGAREAGLADVGVLYGYGSRAELLDARASRLAASVAELRDMLL